MPKLRNLAPLVRTLDTSTTRLPPKQMDPVYNTPEFTRWRAICEAIENGQRCTRAKPQHRVYADHIVELRDGGSLTDPNNGQCLCKSHHELKTIAARKQRFGIS